MIMAYPQQRLHYRQNIRIHPFARPSIARTTTLQATPFYIKRTARCLSATVAHTARACPSGVHAAVVASCHRKNLRTNEVLALFDGASSLRFVDGACKCCCCEHCAKKANGLDEKHDGICLSKVKMKCCNEWGWTELKCFRLWWSSDEREWKYLCCIERHKGKRVFYT